MTTIQLSYLKESSCCNSQVQGSKTKTSELKSGMELDKETRRNEAAPTYLRASEKWRITEIVYRNIERKSEGENRLFPAKKVIFLHLVHVFMTI